VGRKMAGMSLACRLPAVCMGDLRSSVSLRKAANKSIDLFLLTAQLLLAL
jgi:hypothetical protein